VHTTGLDLNRTCTTHYRRLGDVVAVGWVAKRGHTNCAKEGARPKDTTIRLDRALVLALGRVCALTPLLSNVQRLRFMRVGRNWVVVRFGGGLGGVGAKQKGRRCVDGVARGS